MQELGGFALQSSNRSSMRWRLNRSAIKVRQGLILPPGLLLPGRVDCASAITECPADRQTVGPIPRADHGPLRALAIGYSLP